ncbi:MAG: 6-carboxytetrahydropterin synthase [Flavobacteriales bacterium]|jgi:6-pyruvoyltetrahydropterin/6-carboxytetrahydropterin synthase|nr:6-carboxytetrahydropterin synthase [Flavobacteriales bacterium]
MKIRITKEFDFETAHALDGYEGKCKDIHGHSYHLKVTLIGEPTNDICLSDCGMVIDFGDIKKIVREHVYEEFDHRLILRKDSRFLGLEKMNPRIRYVDYQPTCENMLIEIVTMIQKELKGEVALHSAFLRETATSYAEWYASDNM